MRSASCKALRLLTTRLCYIEKVTTAIHTHHVTPAADLQ